jgi:hypothetical protein
MHSRTLESIVAQLPGRRPISRIAIVVLCVGLFVGPTLGLASSGSLPASGSTAAPAPHLSPSAGDAATETNTSSAKPVETVTIELQYGGTNAISLTFTATAKKLNQSTVVIVHHHTQTVKKWYTSDEMVLTAGAWNISSPLLKNRLATAIEITDLYKNTIKPYVRSHHKTGREGYEQVAEEARQSWDETYNLPDLPDPVTAVKNIITAAVTSIINGIIGLIETFHAFVLTLPAPGEALNPATWFPDSVIPISSTAPTTSTDDTNASAIPSVVNGGGGHHIRPSGASTGTTSASVPSLPINLDAWWETVWTIYGGLTALVVLPVFVSWIYAWTQTARSPREREQSLRQVATAVGMILGGLIVLPLTLHLTNQLALGIVPDAGQLMQTPEGIVTFGLGFVIGVFLTAVESGLVFVGLVFVFIQWVLVFFIVAAWPLFAVCLASGNRYLNPYGQSGVVAFGTLVVLKLLQAIWLRFLMELPLSFANVGGSLITLVTICVGVVLGFIYLPYYAVTNISPTFISTVGTPSATGGRRSHRRYQDEYAEQSSSTSGSGSQRGQSSAAGSSESRTRGRSDSLSASAARTDGQGQAASSSSSGPRSRSRRVDVIRNRAYRQFDASEQFPDTGDGSVDTPERTRTTADTGSSGRTLDGVAGTVTETTGSVVGKAESAAGTVGTAVAVAAELRQNAKTRWEGVKRFWHTSLPGNRSRRPLKPVEPLSKKVQRNAKAGWKGAKQRGRAGTDRLVDRDRRQRQDQRREHVREQQATAEDPTEDTTTGTETETNTTSAEESATDNTATERRRYYTRKDYQKFGDALSERQKSSLRRHAERRYRSRTDAAASSDQTSHSADEGEEEASTATETDDTES